MKTRSSLAACIDHTILKAEATPAQVEALCKEARTFGFASVCVNSVYVPLVARLLSGSDVKVCSVVGFPLGAMSTAAKAFETKQAVADGAQEVDMVIPIGLLKAGQDEAVLADIRAVVEAAGTACVKVILETCLLTDAEKERVCALCHTAGVQFVKTSTGFSTGGATAADVALMKRASKGLLVKASGGVRTLADAQTMLEAGADRIGCSASVSIVEAITE